MRRIVQATLIFVLAGCSGARAAARDSVDAATSTAIRAARERFNAAIASRDTATIASLLLPTYHLISGRSVQSHGVAEEVAVWKSMFADTSLLYVRRTREVRANQAWGLAEELGDWTGRLTAADGPVRVGGSYAAKWQRDTGGEWRLQSEVFTTLHCEGGPQGCKPPDPAAPPPVTKP
ncbi:MAG TPA: nuclear transport factor 2 family protein [Gemmatimonadaceae bacterium]